MSAQATVDFDDAAFTVEFSRFLVGYKGLECKLNIKVDEYDWIDCLYIPLHVASDHHMHCCTHRCAAWRSAVSTAAYQNTSSSSSLPYPSSHSSFSLRSPRCRCPCPRPRPRPTCRQKASSRCILLTHMNIPRGARLGLRVQD